MTDVLIDTLHALLAGLGALAMAYASAWIRSQFRAGDAVAASDALLRAAAGAVSAVEQEFVKELKRASADGKLTRNEARQASDRAYALARTMLGRDGLARARAAHGDELETVLRALIEAQVGR